MFQRGFSIETKSCFERKWLKHWLSEEPKSQKDFWHFARQKSIYWRVKDSSFKKSKSVKMHGFEWAFKGKVTQLSKRSLLFAIGLKICIKDFSFKIMKSKPTNAENLQSNHIIMQFDRIFVVKQNCPKNPSSCVMM